VLGAPTPNAIVMTWAPGGGLDAVPAAVPLVVSLLTGSDDQHDIGDREEK
jgi:hypothetical protein